MATNAFLVLAFVLFVILFTEAKYFKRATEDQSKRTVWPLASRQDVFGVPEQVHISFGVNRTQTWVTWLTFEESTKYRQIPICHFGTDDANLNLIARGYATLWWNVNRLSFVHRVLLTDLKPYTVYYYRCGSDQSEIWTRIFSFRTKPEDEENWNPRIAIYGDMGLENGVSIPFLKSQAEKRNYDAIYHVGDLAYDMHELDGRIGDEFMRVMEPIMARVPYQTAPGNHEWYQNFSQYTNRFTMSDSLTGDQNNHFYSFNIGPVHVVSFSSEWYNWYNYEGEYPSHDLTNVRVQYEWLERDLTEASRPQVRAKRPWIIAASHRAMYCSTMDVDDCAYNESILRKGLPIVNKWGLEELFYKHGVDVILGAHEHTYERLFPVYDRIVYNGSTDDPYRNPKAPVHLLVGSAGCRELLDPFVPHPKPWSALRLDDYGVTEFLVQNKTHMRIQLRSTDKHGAVVDAIMLVKEKHGTEAWL